MIRKVCEAGTFAPSGGNRQPWTFVAVTEPERRAFVAERYRRAFAGYIAPALEAAKDPAFPDAKRRNIAAALHLAEHMHEVPVQLFVAGWLRRGEPQLQALFPAVQNILLACRAVGLGASLTNVHRAFGAEIDAFLGLGGGSSDLRADPDRLAARSLRSPAAPLRRRMPVLGTLSSRPERSAPQARRQGSEVPCGCIASRFSLPSPSWRPWLAGFGVGGRLLLLARKMTRVRRSRSWGSAS